MRRWTRATRGAALGALCALAWTAGCSWKARSGLPAHIRSVEVEQFGNVTFEPGLEARFTRQLKKLVNEDPQVKLVNGGGDARISGKILKVTRSPERLGRDDHPVSMSVVVEVEYTFYDTVEQKYLVEKRRVNSRQASSLAGQYPAAGPATEQDAMDAAALAVARAVVRDTVGMW